MGEANFCNFYFCFTFRFLWIQFLIMLVSIILLIKKFSLIFIWILKFKVLNYRTLLFILRKNRTVFRRNNEPRCIQSAIIEYWADINFFGNFVYIFHDINYGKTAYCDLTLIKFPVDNNVQFAIINFLKPESFVLWLFDVVTQLMKNAFCLWRNLIIHPKKVLLLYIEYRVLKIVFFSLS